MIHVPHSWEREEQWEAAFYLTLLHLLYQAAGKLRASGSFGCLSKQTRGTEKQQLLTIQYKFRMYNSTVIPKNRHKAISPIKLTSAAIGIFMSKG